MKYIVGIDEVGRGPLAGPVTVCIVACEEKFYTKLKRDKLLPPLGKDSKKLSPKARGRYVLYLNKLCRRPPSAKFAEGGLLQITIAHVSNKIIDKKGISFAIRKGIEICFKNLKLENYLKIKNYKLKILLDGGLNAPKNFKNQKTIIKGDEKEKVIAWASILAKVSRDTLMSKLAKKYPQYGLEIHKGYGTFRHGMAIRRYGLSDIHRKSFCKKYI